MGEPLEIVANVVNIRQRCWTPSTVVVRNGRIAAIRANPPSQPTTFLLPGFVDSHVHVESSMLVPSEFARAAVRFGTVATVSDPHEIGNVLGMEGVEFMLANAATVPFKFCFGAPACVPATPHETAGAILSVEDVQRLLQDPRIGYLSEVMDFPAVLRREPNIMAKIAAAQTVGKVVDGHAPGLRGADAARYVSAGISTDHECVSLKEAVEKIAAGCQIAIREGSAARNFDALFPLLQDHPDRVMFCSDDKHPDELLNGHIDTLVRRAVEKGADLFHVLQAACINPVTHYDLPVGLLQEGDPADFVEVNNLQQFEVLHTWIDGQLVAEQGRSRIVTEPARPANKFLATEKRVADFQVEAAGDRIHVIEAHDGQLITSSQMEPAAIDPNTRALLTVPERDLLKLTVINRYQDAPPAVAFVRGFGLRSGAMASSVAHDSHNVIAVGADDASLCRAVNLVIESRGGLAVVDGSHEQLLPLPVAGLMSTDPIEKVSASYQELDRVTKSLGSPLRAPFMTLSFMALLVIPQLKLSDLGLFDGERFELIPLSTAH